jgi:hypothetical protein
MTKEDFLRAYLEDEIFLEQKYLKPGEASKYKWSTPLESKLIQVVKLAIEGEVINESMNITERKINLLLNKTP